MAQLAIRCHPRVPAFDHELEQWLEHQLSALRAQAPHATIRLSRLTQARSSADLRIGWLVELEFGDGASPLVGERLIETLRDMRLLGLHPTVLASTAHGASPAATSSPGAGTNGGRS
jgi:hypothetical protein